MSATPAPDMKAGKPEAAHAPGASGGTKAVPEIRHSPWPMRLAVEICLLVVVAVVSPPCFVLLAVAMLPSILSWLIDKSPGRVLATKVGRLNLAAAMPFMLQVALGSNDWPGAVAEMTGPGLWLAAYGAAGFAWLIHRSSPGIVRLITREKLQRRKTVLTERMKVLHDEWGSEISGEHHRG